MHDYAMYMPLVYFSVADLPQKRPAVPAAVDLIGTDQEVRRSPRLAKVHVQERMHEASPRKLFHASTESLES